MENEQPEFIKFWNKMAPLLEENIEKRRIPEVEAYVTSAFGLFSFYTDQLSSKVENHKEIAHAVYPMIIQIQDMLRTNILCQQNLLFAPVQFNTRIAFEVRANLLYIYNHKDPEVMLNRLIDYVQYEKLVGRKQSPYFPDPAIEEEAAFALKHPYWADQKNKETLKINAKWNGEDKSLYKICDELSQQEKYSNLKNDFYSQYFITSTFIHGSPVVREFYSIKDKGLYSVVSVKRVSSAVMVSTHIMTRLLQDALEFFGISYKEVDFAYVYKFFMDAQGAYGKLEE